jgi:hypothetical protein
VARRGRTDMGRIARKEDAVRLEPPCNLRVTEEACPTSPNPIGVT